MCQRLIRPGCPSMWPYHLGALLRGQTELIRHGVRDVLVDFCWRSAIYDRIGCINVWKSGMVMSGLCSPWGLQAPSRASRSASDGLEAQVGAGGFEPFIEGTAVGGELTDALFKGRVLGGDPFDVILCPLGFQVAIRQLADAVRCAISAWGLERVLGVEGPLPPARFT